VLYTNISRTIDAPVDVVFKAVADPAEFSRTIPNIERVEFLSPNHAGVGTKFRSTRVMKGKRQTMDFEITELVPNDRVRIVNVTHGALWDSTFSVRGLDGRTAVTLTMDVTPPHIFAKIMLRLARGMINKAVDGDMQSIKQYCESRKPGARATA
jgi:uncharacterized protein YndB with AHSA1/START domain